MSCHCPASIPEAQGAWSLRGQTAPCPAQPEQSPSRTPGSSAGSRDPPMRELLEDSASEETCCFPKLVSHRNHGSRTEG